MEGNPFSGVVPGDDGEYRLPHPFKLGLLAAAMVALTLAVTLAPAAEGIGGEKVALAPARALELMRFVRHDCGSCHGLTLAGGLGPALLPHALRGRPVADLKSVILDGRHGTAMPPWSPILSEADAAWIAERLLAGFPDAR